ncbi:hypothetical protein BD410DRAFT_795462 [Rickenella mellea]|uniref:Mixed lineage kinase domain-containing protein n=1 Tax=Rickenella mellea TaxID=50990 RepID=A0A4Y7PMX3_9AGAM|nr:hypothetical protein BD410DRAFT_795462 [Rickenella mellea]
MDANLPAKDKRRPHERSSSKSTADDILANATRVLNLAIQLAPLAPVTFVSTIFATANEIVAVTRNVRQNKTDCAELAERVADLTHDISKQIHGKEECVDEALCAALEQLYGNLQEIKQFMDRQASASMFRRILRRDNIATEITVLRSRLDFSMQTFKTTSTLRLELQMVKLQNKLSLIDERMHRERTTDGQYRIYRLADLHLRQTFVPPVILENGRSNSEPVHGAVEYHQATNPNGQAVILKVKAERESTRRFLCIL